MVVYKIESDERKDTGHLDCTIVQTLPSEALENGIHITNGKCNAGMEL